MKEVEVSIIIPVYNAAEFIKACVASVCTHQGIDNLEVILVDDGSTDQSPVICDDIAEDDSRITVIHRGNAGPAQARNIGISRARGRWLMFVDADDMLLPGSVKVLLDLARDNEAEIAMGRFVRGRVCPSVHCSDAPAHMLVLTPAQAVERLLYQHKADSGVWAKIFDARLFEGLSFPDGIYYEDLSLLPKLYLRASRIVSTHRVVYFYRHTPGSIMNTFNRKRLDVLDVVDRLERELPAELRAPAADRKFSANCNMFVLASRAGYEEAADRCWKVIRSYRAGSLRNSRVRIKNRLGALVTYLGPGFIKALSRWLPV